MSSSGQFCGVPGNIRNDDLGPIEKFRRIVEKVDELGLEPFQPPQAKPMIEEDEVKLVCWMAVAPTDE